ncbi:MAG: corrinoid protein [Bacteroidota bacterium]|nr:corrinoid protein [Bacteroidota bacterium]
MEEREIAETLERLAECVERGKADASSLHPVDLRGRDGAEELTRLLLEAGVPPARILDEGLIPGMGRIGEKFREKQVFVPDVLLAARAMHAAMNHLRPFFRSRAIVTRGTFIIGTVFGDLHDIGKKLVAMVVEGSGWDVVDLGVNVEPERFVAEVRSRPGAVVGLSALLTTTMPNMRTTVAVLKETTPCTPVIVGGAPVTPEFAATIGADAYGADPYAAVEFLHRVGGS